MLKNRMEIWSHPQGTASNDDFVAGCCLKAPYIPESHEFATSQRRVLDRETDITALIEPLDFDEPDCVLLNPPEANIETWTSCNETEGLKSTVNNHVPVTLSMIRP